MFHLPNYVCIWFVFCRDFPVYKTAVSLIPQSQVYKCDWQSGVNHTGVIVTKEFDSEEAKHFCNFFGQFKEADTKLPTHFSMIQSGF